MHGSRRCAMQFDTAPVDHVGLYLLATDVIGAFAISIENTDYSRGCIRDIYPNVAISNAETKLPLLTIALTF